MAEGYASTHAGRRVHNEDAWCAEPELGLFAVADGMGGYAGGDMASQLVLDQLRDFFRRIEPGESLGFDITDHDGKTAVEARMRLAIRLAHRELLTQAAKRFKKMGATLATVLVGDGQALVAHVGDSRVYRLRGGALEQLTRDHSLYSDLEAAGAGAIAQSVRATISHVVTRAISPMGSAEPDICIVDVEPGDRFLVCTDGVTDAVDDEELADLMTDEPDCVPERIVGRAYVNGSSDNITALVVTVP